MGAAREPEWMESNQHFEYGVLGQVLVMRRLATPLHSASEFLDSFLVAVERGRARPELRAILLDTRASMGQTSAEFERVVEESQRRALQHFERMVVLVRSSVGAMQARRLGGELLGAERIMVAADEDEAWRLAAR